MVKSPHKKAPAAVPGLGIAETRLCLDFVNTEGLTRNSPPDRLESSGLFLDWAKGQGLATVRQVAVFRKALAEQRACDRFLGRARELREALYRIFAGLAEGSPAAEADLALLRRELAEALPRLQLVERDGQFRWILPDPPSRPAELLGPIALSAADLLSSDQLDRVKECNGETCSWMFIDESRNRSRRWCDMSDCGNRAKARRFYHRHASR